MILAIGGAILAGANIFYFLNGTGVYWKTGEIQGFLINDWFELQLGSKLHWVFIAKTLAILIASLIVWLRAAQINEPTARFMLLVPLCGAGAFAICGIALWLIDQNDFIYRNGSVLNLIVTLGFVLLGAFLVMGALGIVVRDKKRFWLMVGFLITATANEIANLIVAAAFRLPASVTFGSFVYLAFFSGALVFLLRSRNELDSAS